MNKSAFILFKKAMFPIMAGLVFSVPIKLATAQDSSSKEQPSDSSQETAPESVALPKLDLGTLEIKNLEPTRNQTSKVSFEMHLTFPPDTDPAAIEALSHWQHRIRDQVIVSIRIAELGDYIDPQLIRLRKQILYRINRLLKETPADDVLLADFTFSTE